MPRAPRHSLFVELEPQYGEAINRVGQLAGCTKRQAVEATIADRIDAPHPFRSVVRKAWATYRRQER